MNKTSSAVEIYGAALKAWLRENNLTQMGVSRSIGYKESYISNAICTNRISRVALEVLKLRYGLNPDLIAPLKPAPAPKNDYCIKGYTVALDVRPDKVCFELAFNGEAIVRAWSKIKGKSELDFIQAVSCAAHLCYKLVEQKELEGNNA